MSWLTYGLATIVFYSLFDFFLKISSDKINTWLNAFIVNLVATLVLVIFIVYLKFQGEKLFDMKAGGLLYSILAGLAIGGASIFFVKMFATGTHLSIGVPLVRIGMVILGSMLGVLLLKEGISLRYFMGIALSLLGLFLVIAK